MSTLPLGAYFVGASLVSLTITPWLFRRVGRKMGFLVGIAIGLVGTALGAASVALHSPSLLIVSSFFFGAAMGVGFFLRFAAVEIVPEAWAQKAVAIVVAGGCVAAFAGPETSLATKGIFGPELEYMGVFMMAGIFNVANAISTMLVDFPPPRKIVKSAPGVLSSILCSRAFLVPMIIASLSWAIMALPMGLLRVAMQQVGFSSRQSLLAIELHFVGMYGPGVVTGGWIRRFGTRAVVFLGLVAFIIGMILLQFVQGSASGMAWLAMWIIGMFVVGFAWNCGFTGATVQCIQCVGTKKECMPHVQAANDCLMFLFSGALIFSSSYIFGAAGAALDGWRTIGFVVFGLLGIYAVVLGTDTFFERRKARESSTVNKTHSSSLDVEDGNDEKLES